MARWLDTRGRSTLGIGICDRCSRKMSLDDLFSDPNAPGLRVCKDDLDDLDPWRLAPLSPDVIVLPFARPDVDISTTQHPVSITGQIPVQQVVAPGTPTAQDQGWYATTQDGQEGGPNIKGGSIVTLSE